jgi:hypothetical protein
LALSNGSEGQEAEVIICGQSKLSELLLRDSASTRPARERLSAVGLLAELANQVLPAASR